MVQKIDEETLQYMDFFLNVNTDVVLFGISKVFELYIDSKETMIDTKEKLGDQAKKA